MLTKQIGKRIDVATAVENNELPTPKH